MRAMTLEKPNPDEGDCDADCFTYMLIDFDFSLPLAHARILDPDDQWMYLPAVKRVKRISSCQQIEAAFMGSEFAFEDFSSTEIDKYSYKWLRDEACPEPVADRTCHVTERTPLYEHSGYTRQVAWTDTTDYQPRKIEYYDRKDELLKTLSMTNYNLHEGKFWRAHDLYMQNVVTGKSTRLTWESFEFGTGLTQNDFSTSALQRAR